MAWAAFRRTGGRRHLRAYPARRPRCWRASRREARIRWDQGCGSPCARHRARQGQRRPLRCKRGSKRSRMAESRDREEGRMIQLLDTALGFVAIMAMLSLLVKSLTSLIKSYVDFYSGNLHAEVDSLVQGMLGQGLGELAATHSWLNEINWKSLGEEYLTVDKMKVFLQQLEPGWVDMGDLQARVDLHLANLRYGFERRMKNLALAAGLAVCLLCNVNSIAIWKTLYTDQQLRTTFAKDYSEKALKLLPEDTAAATSGSSAPNQGTANQQDDIAKKS